ncbi:MAG: trigger factor, partial [Rubrobacteraceae bacterium]
MIEVGGGEMLEEFENNLVDMNAGERKQFGVTFPMDYQEESLRGQSVLCQVHAKEIKKRDLPPLDDDFAKEASEFETLDELRAAVREELEQATSQRVEGEFRGRVLDAVAEKAEVEVPEVMVHEKAHEMVESFERSIRSQGIEPEQYYQFAGSSHHEVEVRVRPDAVDTVKKELVLDAVASKEGLAADEETVMHEIGHLAEDSGRKPEEIIKTMRRNGTYVLLEEELARQKALDLLVENAVAVEMTEEEEVAEAEAVAEEIMAEEELVEGDVAEEDAPVEVETTEGDESK